MKSQYAITTDSYAVVPTQVLMISSQAVNKASMAYIGKLMANHLRERNMKKVQGMSSTR